MLRQNPGDIVETKGKVWGTIAVGIVGHVWVKVDIKRLKIAIGVYNWGKVGAQNADKISNINGAKSGHILRKTISLRKNN